AKKGAVDNTYQAVVWKKLWLNLKNLTSFNLVK
ncbi:hypothetical protein Godav_004674, partial [Gossypium davidsonii]|nr:hypothetical protein [Gossypium davidsonii]MBA0662764.1 hypothetical protein [Gossypium klotzschianum]